MRTNGRERGAGKESFNEMVQTTGGGPLNAVLSTSDRSFDPTPSHDPRHPEIRHHYHQGVLPVTDLLSRMLRTEIRFTHVVSHAGI